MVRNIEVLKILCSHALIKTILRMKTLFTLNASLAEYTGIMHRSAKKAVYALSKQSNAIGSSRTI